MSEIDFFPGPLYKKNTIISFPLAQHGYNQWIIETKLSHSNHQRDEAQAKAGRATSYAVGTFRVYNHERCIHAYLRTYLQVPYIGTEFASVEDRAVQATQIRHTEITAVQDLHRRSSRITPALFAIKEGIQTDQDSVPSGYVTHFVFEEVAGIRLAEDDLLPEKGKTHTFFQKFTRSQRDKIRAKFDESYRSLKFMGWWPDFPWATNLVWNDETSTLYFIDFRNAVESDRRDREPDSHSRSRQGKLLFKYHVWGTYGLALPPANPLLEDDPGKWVL